MKEYEAIMPFWIDTDGYTDRDRKMFVCGVEFEMVYQCIKNKHNWNQCIHTENESRVRMMCARMGVQVKMERHCETWTYCEILMSSDLEKG